MSPMMIWFLVFGGVFTFTGAAELIFSAFVATNASFHYINVWIFWSALTFIQGVLTFLIICCRKKSFCYGWVIGCAIMTFYTICASIYAFVTYATVSRPRHIPPPSSYDRSRYDDQPPRYYYQGEAVLIEDDYDSALHAGMILASINIGIFIDAQITAMIMMGCYAKKIDEEEDDD